MPSQHSPSSPPSAPTPWWRRGAVLLSALAIGMTGALLPGLASAAPVGGEPLQAEAVADLLVPAPIGEVPGDFAGTTGGTSAARVQGKLQLTSDGGRSWRVAPIVGGFTSMTRGYLYTQSGYTLRALPVAGGNALEWDSGFNIGALWGTRVAAQDHSGPMFIWDMATQRVVQQVRSDYWGATVVGMGPTGAAWLLPTGQDWTSRQLVVKTWAGAESAPIAYDANAWHAPHVRGDEVRYLHFSATDVQYCRIPLKAPALTCTVIQSGDQRASRWSYEIGGNDAAALIRLRDNSVWLYEGGKKTAVPVDAGQLYRMPALTDGDRPQVVLAGFPFSVSATGALTRTVTYPTGAISQEALGLTPGRLVTTDRSDGVIDGQAAAWTRSVGATTVGQKTLLPRRATSAATRATLGSSLVSGLRSLLVGDNGKAALTDGTRVTAELAGVGSGFLSGPYVLVDGKVLTTAGKDTGQRGTAIFGSRVASLDGRTVTVKDAARPAAAAKSFSVAGDGTAGNSWLVGMYGDWVVVTTSVAGTPARVYTTTAHNLATGQQVARPSGDRWQTVVSTVGDGHAWAQGGLWTFADNKVTPMTFPDASDRVNRGTYRDGFQLIVRTFDGIGKSPARVLGVVAASSLDVSKAGAVWAPEIDATKGIKAGTLEIRNASNVVVRQIATPASETGSVRDVGWDGKSASGVLVPNGTYSWSFNTTSADGTGAVKAVDGTSAVAGQLTIAGSPGFKDVKAGMDHYEHIMWLASRGVTTGYDDGTFRPVQPVNRDAMAAFMYRLAGSPAFDPKGKQSFRDVTPTTQFYKEIEWLSAQGISTGWDVGNGVKEFRPVQPVARDAMAAFLYRLYGKPTFTAPTRSPFVDVPRGTQFYAEMSWLAANGISTGWVLPTGAEFRPLQPVNRDAMAAFMHRGFDKFGQPRP